MRRPSPDDAELKAAIRRYVVPETDGIARYLWLLGADFTYMEEPARTDYAARFIAVGGLWQQWDTLGQTPAQLRDRISGLCSMAKESMRQD
jgi:hypothetical protein